MGFLLYGSWWFRKDIVLNGSFFCSCLQRRVAKFRLAVVVLGRADGLRWLQSS